MIIAINKVFVNKIKKIVYDEYDLLTFNSEEELYSHYKYNFFCDDVLSEFKTKEYIEGREDCKEQLLNLLILAYNEKIQIQDIIRDLSNNK